MLSSLRAYDSYTVNNAQRVWVTTKDSTGDFYIDIDKSTNENVGGTFVVGTPPANQVYDVAVKYLKNKV